MKLDTMTIEVKMNITDETAVLCAGLLDMFCDMRRGDLDIGYTACNGCPLLSANRYCNYRHIVAWNTSKGEKDDSGRSN